MITKTTRLWLGVMGVFALVLWTGGAFVAGLLFGYRDQHRMMAGIHADSAIVALRSLARNDIVNAKQRLLLSAESNLLAYDSLNGNAPADYSSGDVPTYVRLVDRALRNRAALIDDPDIVNYRLQLENDRKPYNVDWEARIAEMEKRFGLRG